MNSNLTNTFIFSDIFLYVYGHLIIHNYKKCKEGIVCVLNDYCFSKWWEGLLQLVPLSEPNHIFLKQHFDD